MRHDRLVDVEEEPREQFLHAHFAQRLGHGGGAGQVEEHHHPLFPDRMAITAEDDGEQHAAADQPRELEDRVEDHRQHERDGEDHGEMFRQPGRRERFAVQHRLQSRQDSPDRDRHRRRAQADFGKQRPSPQPPASH